MKVLHVYRTYFPDPPGGLQEAIRHISLACLNFDIQSTIFTLSPSPFPEKIQSQEGDIIRAKSRITIASCDIGDYSAFLKFSDAIEQVDLIHYHFPWPFGDLLNYFSNSKKPSVLTYHSDITRQRVFNKFYLPLMSRTFNDMSRIIATSPAYAQTSPILQKSEISKKLRIIPLGINENFFLSKSQKIDPLKFEINFNKPFFLFLGVHRYYKGLINLIYAAKKVNVQIVIGGSGPELPKLKNIVKNEKITNVFFTGQLTDAEKIALLQSCYAFILPSCMRSEAFGMVLIEASLLSKPMISTELGTGTSFVNINNQTGFVVPPNSPLDLAKAMHTLLNNPKLAMKFGLAARDRYEKLFSGFELGKAYSRLYREVLNSA